MYHIATPNIVFFYFFLDPPKEDFSLTTFYGLYFNQQVHIYRLKFFVGPLRAAFHISMHRQAPFKAITDTYNTNLQTRLIAGRDTPTSILQRMWVCQLPHKLPPQAGFDLPQKSHASYAASALPPSHHGWRIKKVQCVEIVKILLCNNRTTNL